MWVGTFDVQVDSAGRLTVPARIRADLADEVILTAGFPLGEHLELYDPAAFERRIRTLFPGEVIDPAQASVKQFMLGYAFSLKLDKAGRVLIPQILRELVGLDGAGRCLGMDNHLQIYSERQYQAWLANSRSVAAMAQSLEAMRALAAQQQERLRSTS